jgi:hypothetical protein
MMMMMIMMIRVVNLKVVLSLTLTLMMTRGMRVRIQIKVWIRPRMMMEMRMGRMMSLPPTRMSLVENGWKTGGKRVENNPPDEEDNNSDGFGNGVYDGDGDDIQNQGIDVEESENPNEGLGGIEAQDGVANREADLEDSEDNSDQFAPHNRVATNYPRGLVY